MVLVPHHYSDARQLKKGVQVPCDTKSTEKLCNLYQYINFDKKEGFVKIEAENPGRTQSKVVPLFNDTSVLSKLEYRAMILMSPENVSLFFCCCWLIVVVDGVFIFKKSTRSWLIVSHLSSAENN